jgi:hypothetical protein
MPAYLTMNYLLIHVLPGQKVGNAAPYHYDIYGQSWRPIGYERQSTQRESCFMRTSSLASDRYILLALNIDQSKRQPERIVVFW